VIGYKDMAVVMTVWRRPGYTRKALASWENVRGVGELGLFRVYVDPSDRQDEILSVCAEFQDGIPGLSVEVNPERYGVSCNPEFSMARGFREHGAAFSVVGDDDMLVSTDVLEYLRWGADTFEDRKDVAAVCAHTPEPAPADSDQEAVQLLPRYRCWTWGTWRDRWDTVFEPTWDRHYDSGEPAGYDWNIDLRVVPGRGLRCVFPLASRSQNIGRFEGVHASPAEFLKTANPSFRQEREPVSYRVIT
jgi:hypothetical protein